MKKTIIFSLLFCATASITAYAQEETPSFKRNTVYGELAGTTPLSVNFDRVFNPQNYFKFSARVGLAYFYEYSRHLKNETNRFYMPLGLYGFTGRKNGHFETGIFFVPQFIRQKFESYYRNDENRVFNAMNNNVGLSLGYRYQKPEGGFFFAARVNLTFLQYRINNNGKGRLVDFRNLNSLGVPTPMPGLSFGYTF